MFDRKDKDEERPDHGIQCLVMVALGVLMLLMTTHNVVKMVEIFRVVHNYIDTRKKDGKETTLAIRLGLSQAPMGYIL